jgi:ABC-type dipeptide/oligopeptide/nickel transport system permease component
MVSGDIPFSMFYLVFMAALTLLGTLIADILYAVVDPRSGQLRRGYTMSESREIKI